MSYDFAISTCMKSHTFCIRLAIDLAIALASCSRIDKAERSTGLKLIYGTTPCDARNREIFVVAEMLAFSLNSTIGSSSTQSS